jgi:hypothetical protein
MSGQGGRPAHAVDMPDMQGSACGGPAYKFTRFIYIFSLHPTVFCQSRVKSDSGCTAMTQYRKFETNISRKGIARPQFQFQHSCVCERFMYSHDRSAYSTAGNMWKDLGNI